MNIECPQTLTLGVFGHGQLLTFTRFAKQIDCHPLARRHQFHCRDSKDQNHGELGSSILSAAVPSPLTVARYIPASGRRLVKTVASDVIRGSRDLKLASITHAIITG